MHSWNCLFLEVIIYSLILHFKKTSTSLSRLPLCGNRSSKSALYTTMQNEPENKTKPPKIAFLHRYGLGGWICCGGHCIPRTFEILLENQVELHYFGPRSMDPTPGTLTKELNIHQLPYSWDRSNPAHKWSRTIIWYLYLPWIALYCRIHRMDVLMYIDDTLPLTGWIFRLCFGRKFSMTAMDFFLRIYTEKQPLLKPVCKLVEWLDFLAWRRTPVLYTKVFYTQEYLRKKKIPAGQMHIARNPCNQDIYHPISDDARQRVRSRLGIEKDDIVLSHHGILHPNKGNDWILSRIAEVKDQLPKLKFLLSGDGPEMKNLKQYAETFGLSDRIIFTGWVPSENELNETLCAADLGLVMRMGQETDHFHMTDTLTHEMACAKPILTVNLHGIAEIIDEGVNGYLFNPDNPAEFTNKLTFLYNNKDEWKTLGQNALDTIGRISNLETCANQLAQPILKLLNSG